ncbi:MAG: hypothetical protein ACKKMV_03070 [Candidatus Nealsonbacteria bacterium]
MSQKIKIQKGFIQIPLLIAIIVSVVAVSAVTTGVVLYKQGKLTPLIASVSQVFQETKELEPEIKSEEPKTEQEQSLLEETNQEENSQTAQELEQAKLEAEKAKQEAERAKAETERLKAEQEAQRIAEEQQRQEELREQQEAQRITEEKARQEAEEVKRQQEIKQARQLELQRQLEIQRLAEEQRRLEEDAYQEPESLTYLELNKPYISKTGIAVTVTNIEKVEEMGSYKYIISYKQENKTTDKKLDEGTFKMFFEDGTGLNQYGFFDKLFPNESTTKTYTFQILKTQKPLCIEFNDDIDAGLEGAFFRNQPATDTLKWRIE